MLTIIEKLNRIRLVAALLSDAEPETDLEQSAVNLLEHIAQEVEGVIERLC